MSFKKDYTLIYVVNNTCDEKWILNFYNLVAIAVVTAALIFLGYGQLIIIFLDLVLESNRVPCL